MTTEPAGIVEVSPPAAASWRRWVTWSHALAFAPLIVGGVHVAFFMLVVIRRFLFPVELEWMSGGVADHVERVMAGQPIYVAPSASFVPYVYPPLHYWLTAIVARAMPIMSAGRLVSVIATVIAALAVFRATRALGKSTYWALVATSLFFGAYSLTGYWYDLDRSDSLVIAMLGVAFVIALEREGALASVVVGALLGGALFAKQPASVFLIAAVLAMILARRPRVAAAIAAGGALVLVPGVAILNAKTDGWFWYYCVKMPAAHGVRSELASLFFVVDGGKGFALFMATIAVLLAFAGTVVAALRRRVAIDRTEALFGAFVAAGLFTSATSRMHIGGYVNVLVFLTTFGAIAFGVGASRLAKESKGPLVPGLLAAVALAQLMSLLYDPGEAAPNEGRVRDAKIVEARVRELEKGGEVIVHGRGNLTHPRHFHIMAMMDVFRADMGVPDDLAQKLRARAYAAYVIDEFPELSLEPVLGRKSELYELVMRNYFVAQRLDDREPPPVVGWIAHPSWVLRPRKTPLDRATPAEVERRQRVEMGVCEMRMRAVQAGVRKVDDGADIEELAAALDAPIP